MWMACRSRQCTGIQHRKRLPKISRKSRFLAGSSRRGWKPGPELAARKVNTVKLCVIRALLWMIRTFKFFLVLDDGPSVYDWRIQSGKMVDYFESPNVRGGYDAFYVCCELRTAGFLSLAWAILTRSTLGTRHWRKTHTEYHRTDERVLPLFERCRCHAESLQSQKPKEVVFIDISRLEHVRFNPRHIGILWNGPDCYQSLSRAMFGTATATSCHSN